MVARAPNAPGSVRVMSGEKELRVFRAVKTQRVKAVDMKQPNQERVEGELRKERDMDISLEGGGTGGGGRGGLATEIDSMSEG